MLVIRLILTIFAGSDSIPNIIVSVLFMAGLWRMFEKSGLQGWWACSIPLRGCSPRG